MNFEEITIKHCPEVLDLYRRVALVPGGLARLSNEINEDYIHNFISKTVEQGIGYVARDGNKVVGEIHAYKSGLFCFSHVLSDLTVAIDPESQGEGAGRKIFEKFLTEVIECYPEITRIELIARESNKKAIQFYESLEFVVEGRFSARIKNIDGTYEADIPMAWIRA